MTTPTHPTHELLLNTLIDRYQREGFEVLKEPDPNVVPFDLGGYKPDLIANKEGQHLIIEVKTQAERISFDRLRTVANEVKQHNGWRFVLVTGQDVEYSALPGQSVEAFSWSEVTRALDEAQTPAESRAQALAFIGLWVVFEKMMRYQSRRIALPIDRLASPRTMIDQLYSHGELSAEQYEVAIDLIPIRNRVVHGLNESDLSGDLRRLSALVRELQYEWSSPSGEIANE